MRANAEKETQRLSQRLAEIERSCSKLREEVAQLANENDVLKSNLADAHSKLTAASAAGVSKEAVVEDSHSSSSTTSEVEEPHESSTLTVTTLNRRVTFM
jgi:septal ring factor EnvC (AmiA/AmiB activator)